MGHSRKRKALQTQDTKKTKKTTTKQPERTEQFGSLGMFSDEVILHVLSFLENPKDLSNFSQTSQAANHLVRQEFITPAYIEYVLFKKYGIEENIKKYNTELINQLNKFFSTKSNDKSKMANEWKSELSLPISLNDFHNKLNQDIFEFCKKIDENKYPLIPIKSYLAIKHAKPTAASKDDMLYHNIINLYRIIVSSDNQINYIAYFLRQRKGWGEQIIQIKNQAIRSVLTLLLHTITENVKKRLLNWCQTNLPLTSATMNTTTIEQRMMAILTYTAKDCATLPLQSLARALDQTLLAEHRSRKNFTIEILFNETSTAFGKAIMLERALRRYPSNKRVLKSHFPQLYASNFSSLNEAGRRTPFNTDKYNYLNYLCNHPAFIPIVKNLLEKRLSARQTSIAELSEQSLSEEIKITMDQHFASFENLMTKLFVDEIRVLLENFEFTINELYQLANDDLLIIFRNLLKDPECLKIIRDNYRKHGINAQLNELAKPLRKADTDEFDKKVILYLNSPSHSMEDEAQAMVIEQSASSIAPNSPFATPGISMFTPAQIQSAHSSPTIQTTSSSAKNDDLNAEDLDAWLGMQQSFSERS